MGVNKYDHIGKESSRVEYMAQKQNRIYQRLLDDKIHNIDKDFTLAKLGHRMFVKQLKYGNNNIIVVIKIFRCWFKGFGKGRKLKSIHINHEGFVTKN